MEPICEVDDRDVASYWGAQVLGLASCFLLFVRVCGCNFLLKMELEEMDENKMQIFY
jgi:hypothetical protein